MYYDSDSDLTEDDGDYRPSISSRSKKTGAAPQKQGGYRIKGVLKVPRPTTYTTQAIYGALLRRQDGQFDSITFLVGI